MKKIIFYAFFSVYIVVFILSITLSPIQAAESYELFIAQGIQKINEKDYNKALEFLIKAVEMSPENMEALYYTAVAYSRLGRIDEAEKLFLDTLEKDDAIANIHLELGRIYFVKRNCSRAGNHLTRFISMSDDKSAVTYAQDLMRGCGKTGKEGKKYKVNLLAGIWYDDNVVLEATNPPVGVDNKNDGRLIAMLTAGVMLFENRPVKVKIDYNLYRSNHFALNDFNVFYNKISPSVELNVSDVITPSTGYALEYIDFGQDLYGSIHTYFAKVNVKEGENLSTDAVFEYRHSKYFDTDIFSSNSLRTGNKRTLGVKQHFARHKLKGEVYYFYDDKSARAMYWAYNASRVGAALSYRISSPLVLRASAGYDRRKYKQIFPGMNDSRVDRMYQYAVKLTYFASERIHFTLTEDYTVNDSNLRDFDYKRNMVGMYMTFGLI